LAPAFYCVGPAPEQAVPACGPMDSSHRGARMAKDSGPAFVPRMRPAHSRPRLAAIRSPEASAMLSAERRTQQWASLRGCGAIPLNGARTSRNVAAPARMPWRGAQVTTARTTATARLTTRSAPPNDSCVFQVRVPRLSSATEAAIIATSKTIKDINNMAALLSVTSKRKGNRRGQITM
jgi:hypothetical protein